MSKILPTSSSYRRRSGDSRSRGFNLFDVPYSSVLESLDACPKFAIVSCVLFVFCEE